MTLLDFFKTNMQDFANNDVIVEVICNDGFSFCVERENVSMTGTSFSFSTYNVSKNEFKDYEDDECLFYPPLSEIEKSIIKHKGLNVSKTNIQDEY